ncbi:MAG: SGNH/GDSL hydrolase family protein [Verrucomicrobiae bacterium]
MKKPLAALSLALAASAHAQTQDVRPTWELGKNAIDPASILGKIECIDGVVKLDGQSSFAIPASALGAQNDYTIEFELRRSPNFKTLPRTEGALRLISNRDAEAHAGLSFLYFPPEWDLNGGISNRTGIEINGYWNGESAGLDREDFNKFSLVVKDKRLALYRNGLLWALTDDIKPTQMPLTIGGKGWRGSPPAKEGEGNPVQEPYELRNLKIYDQALPPANSDPNSAVMRNCCGDQYSIQCAVINDPTLPRILVVGDSISMGYRGFITEHFKGRAYVDYWVGGAWFDWTVKGDDFPLLRGWSGVIANGPYDVVTWNSMTLHMWANNDVKRTSEERYPAQMARVLDHLKAAAPQTKFIWIRCTPVTTPVEGAPNVLRQGDDKWKNDRIIHLNQVTDEIMAKYSIPEVDLYALCEKNLDKASKDGVHWGGDASKLMAEEIIKEIEKNLPMTHKQVPQPNQKK